MGIFDFIKTIGNVIKSGIDRIVTPIEKATGIDIPFFGISKKEEKKPSSPPTPKPEQPASKPTKPSAEISKQKQPTTTTQQIFTPITSSFPPQSPFIPSQPPVSKIEPEQQKKEEKPVIQITAHGYKDEKGRTHITGYTITYTYKGKSKTYTATSEEEKEKILEQIKKDISKRKANEFLRSLPQSIQTGLIMYGIRSGLIKPNKPITSEEIQKVIEDLKQKGVIQEVGGMSHIIYGEIPPQTKIDTIKLLALAEGKDPSKLTEEEKLELLAKYDVKNRELYLNQLEDYLYKKAFLENLKSSWMLIDYSKELGKKYGLLGNIAGKVVNFGRDIFVNGFGWAGTTILTGRSPTQIWKDAIDKKIELSGNLITNIKKIREVDIKEEGLLKSLGKSGLALASLGAMAIGMGSSSALASLGAFQISSILRWEAKELQHEPIPTEQKIIETALNIAIPTGIAGIKALKSKPELTMTIGPRRQIIYNPQEGTTFVKEVSEYVFLKPSYKDIFIRNFLGNKLYTSLVNKGIITPKGQTIPITETIQYITKDGQVVGVLRLENLETGQSTILPFRGKIIEHSNILKEGQKQIEISFIGDNKALNIFKKYNIRDMLKDVEVSLEAVTKKGTKEIYWGRDSIIVRDIKQSELTMEAVKNGQFETINIKTNDIHYKPSEIITRYGQTEIETTTYPLSKLFDKLKNLIDDLERQQPKKPFKPKEPTLPLSELYKKLEESESGQQIQLMEKIQHEKGGKSKGPTLVSEQIIERLKSTFRPETLIQQTNQIPAKLLDAMKTINVFTQFNINGKEKIDSKIDIDLKQQEKTKQIFTQILKTDYNFKYKEKFQPIEEQKPKEDITEFPDIEETLNTNFKIDNSTKQINNLLQELKETQIEEQQLKDNYQFPPYNFELQIFYNFDIKPFTPLRLPGLTIVEKKKGRKVKHKVKKINLLKYIR